jgi:hypothetical protein
VPAGEDTRQCKLLACRQPQMCGDCATTACAVYASVVRRWQLWGGSCDGRVRVTDKCKGQQAGGG